MTSAYRSHVGLVFNKHGAFFISASNPTQLARVNEPHVPGVLEIFTHHHSLPEAHRAYQRARETRAACLPTLSNLMAEMISSQAALLLVKQKVFVCASDSLLQAYQLVADPYMPFELAAKASEEWSARGLSRGVVMGAHSSRGLLSSKRLDR